MNNSLRTARSLLNSIGWQQPGDISIEDIAMSQGILIRNCTIKGSEGRILMNGDSAIVSINSAITHPGKRNFVIAHEIGHFCLHKHLAPLYSDTEKTLSEWHTHGIHETEANEFASEFLMPSHLFKKLTDGKKLNIELISSVADYFSVSLTAAFLRYRLLGDFPLMVIYIENGIVQWKQETTDFPFKWLPKGTKLPAYSVAGDRFYQNTKEENPEKVDAIEWFPTDFKLKYDKDRKLWEQCFQVSSIGLISCLWSL